MRKTIFTIVAVLMAGMGMQAVADDYLPLVREGVRWHCTYYENDDEWNFYYEFKGDTIINGNVYKKLYRSFVDGPDLFIFGPTPINETTLECCMMEKDKVVYAIYEKNDFYRQDIRFIFGSEEFESKYETEYGIMLYDFNQPAESITGRCAIQGVNCYQYATKLDLDELDWDLNMELIEGYGYKRGDYVMCTLPYPYNPTTTCNCGWYCTKLTDTNGNKLFNPFKDFSGINDVKVDETVKDMNYYNLQGQRVDIKSAPAGIYIHGGKKVVVK